MSIGLFPIAEPALAQAATQASIKKPPHKRQTVALADRAIVPEPR